MGHITIARWLAAGKSKRVSCEPRFGEGEKLRVLRKESECRRRHSSGSGSGQINLLRTATTVVVDGDRTRSTPLCGRRKGYRDKAACPSSDACSACVGLCKVVLVSPSD